MGEEISCDVQILWNAGFYFANPRSQSWKAWQSSLLRKSLPCREFSIHISESPKTSRHWTGWQHHQTLSLFGQLVAVTSKSGERK